METYSKPALTYKQQVDLLRSRGMIVPDESSAERLLANISYYRLSAYMLPYKEKRNGIIVDSFKEGTSWDNVYDLYMLQTVDPTSSFKDSLKSLLDEYKGVVSLPAMGFSAEWKKEMIWK